MLLQISEPGQSTIKEACKPRVVGIDLGTTNSLVAHVEDSAPMVLGDDPIVPSVVHYGANGDGVLVGRAAQDKAIDAPRQTLASVKRLIGRGLKDIGAVRALIPYELSGDDRAVNIKLADREVSPVEVSAEILKELKGRAEQALGGPIEGAVITVPAYFDDAQRQATRDAGRLAGLEVMRLMAEPTAAAVAYGLDKGTKGTYAVFDLGGGTFDISILKLVEGVFEVKATGGDSALGGDDLDRAIAQELFAADVTSGDAHRIAKAVAHARSVKEQLTSEDSVDGVSRADLRRIAQPLLDKCGKACRRVLKDAELSKDELDGVILVGGSTRSPVVRDYVREVFGKEPLHDLDPDQVVALGAAVQADVLAGGEQKVVLLDVVPLSLGLEMMGGVVEKLIHRNTTIPCGATETFTTYADNQTGFDVHVVQGERETVDACRSLARFTLRGIPPMIAGMARLEVTFLVDADGLLKVMAKELTTGKEASIEVKPSYGLTDEEVERMLIESFEHAEDDLAKRNLLIERVEAERILAATKQAFATDTELLTDDVRAAGEKAMAELQAAIGGDAYLKIRHAIEALDVATKPFAQARMNRAIEAGFLGKTLEEAEALVPEGRADVHRQHAGDGHAGHKHDEESR
ncbi:MAG TPA: Fe-S protein assembly chaperone HscA [Kofleriaceae bacterium]|nr:Fe-S protein assembly chaperone HscA [Kofleriaceae bacterium]